MGRTIMNRWAVQRYVAADLWLRDRTRRVTARLSVRTSDRGQTSFEYLGIAVVIAVIIGVLATTDIGTSIKDAITNTIDKITGGGGQ
jgi:Flp pilus assembly pilin Flp